MGRLSGYYAQRCVKNLLEHNELVKAFDEPGRVEFNTMV